MSGETHTYKGSSHSSETSYSSSDDDTEIAGFDNKIRVYDARFKIPARQSVGQLMTGKTKDPKSMNANDKLYREMVKDVERYKKFVNSSVTALMVVSMLFCWIILVYHWAYL